MNITHLRGTVVRARESRLHHFPPSCGYPSLQVPGLERPEDHRPWDKIDLASGGRIPIFTADEIDRYLDLQEIDQKRNDPAKA